MPEIKEIFMKMTEALEAADRGHKILNAKIASQAQEIKTLREKPETPDCSEAVRGLVEKLASVGVIDNLDAVYFKENVNCKNASDLLVKLASAVTPQKTYPSPYEVSDYPVAETGKNTPVDEALTDCNKKLQAMLRK